jgi:hypothetical protein
MSRGERGSGVTESPVSTLLVLGLVLSVLAPLAEGVRLPQLSVGPGRLIVSAAGLAPAFGSATPASIPAIDSGPPTGRNFDYVVVILLENKGICDILTTCGGTAPYLTSLANVSGLATHSRDCTYPSLPNYLCLTAADSFGCTTNAPPHSNACTDAAWNATNLVDRLESAGLTWKAYMEDMPSNCYPDNDYPLYAVKHNPFVYYSDIATNATRCARDIPSGASNHVLLDDLNSTATASNYMWFTPNLCHNMHDCTVAAGDAFLAGLVPRILGSPVFQTRRGALLITFDEDRGGLGGPNIYTVWAGSVAKRGHVSDAPYDHFSALHTIEANWRLPTLNGNDTAAAIMDEFFLGDLTARFDFSPAWPQGNATVTFDASASSDSDPNATLQYRWDWTDDSTWDTPWSTTPTASHAYTPAGLYTAALQIQDSDGGLNGTTRTVPIDDASPWTTASLSGPPGENGWYTGPVTVTLTATDDRSGVAKTTYRLDGGAAQDYRDPISVSGEGNHTISYGSEDRATNVERDKTASIRIDSVAPSTDVTYSGTLDGDVFVSPILVHLAATDATSGVANTSYSIDGGAWTNYTLPFLVDNDGTHSVQYYSEDVAGNVERTKGFSVITGTIAGIALSSRATLTGTAGLSGWYTSDVTVGLQLVNGTSPPDSIWYRLDGGAWTRDRGPFVVRGDGLHSLDFNATDGAGLVEIVHHLLIPIDTTAPASTANVSGTAGNAGWYVSAATVALSSTDVTSGVASISYRVDGSDWLPYAAPIDLSEGRHAIEFYATDIAGLNETVHTLRVNVDTTPPVTTASRSGRTGSNGWYISDVSVSLNATDAGSGPAIILYRVDGAGWKSYSVPFVISEGPHAIDFYGVDVAGVVAGVQSIDVWVDTTPPAATIALSGRSGANGWFVSDVSVNLSATDGTSGVAALWYRIDQATWLAYSGPFTLGEGRHTVEYYAVDVAGNVGAAKSQGLSIDTTAPVAGASLTGTLGDNGWYRSNVTVSLGATDATSGIADLQYRVDNGPWLAYSGPFDLFDGEHVVDFFATDVAGLRETVLSRPVRINTVAPVTTASVAGTRGDNGWYITQVTVNLTAEDGTGGGVDILYRLDGGAWTVYSSPLLLGDGEHLLEYYATDQAGNSEPGHSLGLSIDTADPQTTASVPAPDGQDGWYLSTPAVDLHASDATSGVAQTSYRLDGGAWQPFTGPFFVGPGRHVLEFYSTDRAGRTGGVESFDIDIDTTGPVTTRVPSGTRGDNGWFVSDVSITLSASDPGSGVAVVQYRIDGGAWHVYEGPLLLSQGGAHVVEFTATDVAGNRESVQRIQLDIDGSAPYFRSLSPSSEPDVSPVRITWDAADTDSGIAGYEIRVDGGSFSAIGTAREILLNLSEGRHVIEVKAVDQAGRSTTETLSLRIVSAQRTAALPWNLVLWYFIPWYVVPIGGAGAGFAAAALEVARMRPRRKTKGA